jgi:hypothetical protein
MDDSSLLEAFQQAEPWAEKAAFDRFFEPLVLYASWITGER